MASGGSSTYRFKSSVDRYHHGWRLDEYLAHRFRYHPFEMWQTRLADGTPYQYVVRAETAAGYVDSEASGPATASAHAAAHAAATARAHATAAARFCGGAARGVSEGAGVEHVERLFGGEIRRCGPHLDTELPQGLLGLGAEAP